MNLVREEGTTKRQVMIDGSVALVLTLVCVLTAPLLNSGNESLPDVDVLGCALIVVSCMAVAARRLFPVMVLLASGAGVSTYLAIGYPYGPIFFAMVAGVYSVARRRSTRRAIALALLVYLGLLVHLLTNEASLSGPLGLVPAAGWVAIPLTVGVARRLVSEARTREHLEKERRLKDAERLHLAHEVHDIVGHGLAAIKMQADIALHVADSKPEQGRIALEAISSATGAALEELRETLGSMTPDPGERERAPTPGVARIEDLCRRISDAGAEVEVVVAGEPRAVESAVDLATYRVVQESLTNVVKHAISPRALVHLTYELDSIVVRVTSPHDQGPLVEGFGIQGMRRRVLGLGGELSVDHGDTVEVVATLPSHPS